ncbi:MAG: hypothetical protein FJ315_05055, partial [SAR202 cluster bacterium]|nr:hypothetical protein [SAR202 cluster bacterium]
KPLGELRSAMQTGSTNGTAHPSLIHQLTSREMLLPALLFSGTILALAMHKPIENLLGLSKNSMLLGTAMAAAGIVLLIARSGARELVEKRVEWWTLTFFLLLFASVAALRMTGVTEMLAARLASATGENELALFLTFTWGAGIASAFMDNILAVATLIPVVQDLEQMGVNVFPLWWGLLFGGAFLGNLTMIGSTANIVAIGMMERRGMGQITMTAWLKVAAIPAVLTLAVASAALALQIF